ncbi:polysaccharide pyruvyl transferase family protein [Lactiplantibacillus paraplantarum]|uniref:polysaccharide pyruvyl transferase family protein n=1 Tax=Lactiplantibacillus paraplantarum TaxID=60520 RepID=UPI003DA52FB6
MRVAINTLVGYYNYGNRLQNYALQQVLIGLGHEVTTIRNYTDIPKPLKKRVFESMVDGSFFHKLSGRIIRSRKSKEKEYSNQIREKNFIDFTRKYIRESTFILNQNTVDFSFDKLFDCYVIGSDQVWNYGFVSFSEYDFVEYSSKPKISYAASFGVSKIPEKYRDFYRKGLLNLTSISVREDAGKSLIQDLSGRDAKVVLDPTLLLDKTEWMAIVSVKHKYDDKYVLTYFLDNVARNDRMYIERFAKKNGLIIKDLVSESDLELWKADPAEFINLFSQAEAVFTDSFHASVFSIIFEKYFEVFSRNNKGPSMNSRLETLLHSFGLDNRWHSSKSKLEVIDYKTVYSVLNQKKRESLDFLKKALEKAEMATKNG